MQLLTQISRFKRWQRRALTSCTTLQVSQLSSMMASNCAGAKICTCNFGKLAVSIVAPFGPNTFWGPYIRPNIRSYGIKIYEKRQKRPILAQNTEYTTEYSPDAEWPNPYGATMAVSHNDEPHTQKPRIVDMQGAVHGPCKLHSCHCWQAFLENIQRLKRMF